MSFEKERADRIAHNETNRPLRDAAREFGTASISSKYSYNFTWMGRPIIQYPQDMIAMQELIWEIKPDAIIETGIAHGGSLIFYASLLELISVSGYGEGRVIGIDVDIRRHNREAIERHSISKRIEMIEGSSIDPKVVARVTELVRRDKKIMVVLDSNHTHSHVLAELEAYAPLTSLGSYCIVFDTIIEDLPGEFFNDRPWGPGNNAKTAVREFLETNKNFNVDQTIQNKLLLTVAPDGYLKRVN